jgi:hypothetical protein
MIFYRIISRNFTDEEFLTPPFISQPHEGAWLPCLACKEAGREPTDEPDYDYCSACWGQGSFEYNPDNPEHQAQYSKEGLSCFESLDDLAAYVLCAYPEVAERWQDEDEEGALDIIEFEGEQVGVGWDNEPLAIPKKVLRRINYREFIDSIELTWDLQERAKKFLVR